MSLSKIIQFASRLQAFQRLRQPKLNLENDGITFETYLSTEPLKIEPKIQPIAENIGYIDDK